MTKISNTELIKYIQENDLVIYSKGITLTDSRETKIETELILSLRDNNIIISTDPREIFYCDLEDKIAKKIFINLGEIYLDNNIIKFEKIVDSDYIDQPDEIKYNQLQL